MSDDAKQIPCKGCGVLFTPTFRHRKYHDDACLENHHRIENRDQMKKKRKSPIGRVNMGGLMDLIDKEGPITMRRNGRTYIFSTLSKTGRVQVPA